MVVPTRPCQKRTGPLFHAWGKVWRFLVGGPGIGTGGVWLCQTKPCQERIGPQPFCGDPVCLAPPPQNSQEMLNKSTSFTTPQLRPTPSDEHCCDSLSSQSSNPPFPAANPPPALLSPNTRQDKSDDYVPKGNNGFHQENIEQDAPRKGSSQASRWQSPQVSKLDRPCHRQAGIRGTGWLSLQ